MSRGNSIKQQKVPNHLRKIPNLVVPSPMARASLRKSLRPIRHRNAYGPQKPWEPRCLVIVTYHETASIGLWSRYVPPMSKWLQKNFTSMYAQIMTPHKILGFFYYFFIIIFFFVLKGIKEPQLHVGHTRILHPPRPKSGP